MSIEKSRTPQESSGSLIWMIFAGLLTLTLGTVSYISILRGQIDNSGAAQEKRFFASLNDGDVVKSRKNFERLKIALGAEKNSNRLALLSVWEPVLKRLEAEPALPERESNVVEVDIGSLKNKLDSNESIDQVVCRALIDRADKFAAEYKYGRACDILRFISRETASRRAITHKREDQICVLFPEAQIKLARLLLAQALRSSAAPGGAVFAEVEEARRAYQVCQNLNHECLQAGLAAPFNSDELTLVMAQCLAMDADFVGAERVLKSDPAVPGEIGAGQAGPGQIGAGKKGQLKSGGKVAAEISPPNMSISASALKFQRGRMFRETGRYRPALATFKSLVDEAMAASDFDMAAASVEQIYTISDDCYLWHDCYGYLLDVLARKPDEKVQAACHAGLAALFFKMADNPQWAENLLDSHRALAVELKDKKFQEEGLKESNAALLLTERNWPPLCLIYSRALQNRIEHLDLTKDGKSGRGLCRLKAAAADGDLLYDQIDTAMVLDNQARVLNNLAESESQANFGSGKLNDAPRPVADVGTAGSASGEIAVGSSSTGETGAAAKYNDWRPAGLPLISRATIQAHSWPVQNLPPLIKHLKDSANISGGEAIALMAAVKKSEAELGTFYGADSLPRALELEYLSRLYIACGQGADALAAAEQGWQIAARSKTFSLKVRRAMLCAYLDSLRAVGRDGAAQHLMPTLRGLSVCL